LTFEQTFDMVAVRRVEHLFECPSRRSEGAKPMALVQMTPVEAHVRWDRSADRPTEIRWAGHQLRVTELDAVRDERAAYPASRGPRVTLLLRTDDGGRASVVFDGRRRRWFLEAIEAVDRAA
jgi:hypothetical protein